MVEPGSFPRKRVSIAIPRSAQVSLEVMDAGILHGIWTAAMLAVFAAIVAWAWSGRRKRDFDEAARLPLDGDDDATESEPGGTRHG